MTYDAEFSPYVNLAVLQPFKIFSRVREVESLDGMLVITTGRFPFGRGGHQIFVSSKALKIGASGAHERREHYYNTMTEVMRFPIGFFSRVLSKQSNGEIAVINTSSFFSGAKFHILDLVTGKVITSGEGRVVLGETKDRVVQVEYQQNASAKRQTGEIDLKLTRQHLTSRAPINA